MKHEVTTLNTKKTLAAALKKAMEKKPLSKISVSEIITTCSLNRKTFYYHFKDIYDLLKWMLEQESVALVKQFDLLVNAEEVIRFVLEYVDANKHIVACAYDSMGREEMKRFFYKDFIDMMRTIIDTSEKQINITVDENYKIFLSNFYTEALAGMLITSVKDNHTDDREKILQYILITIKESIPNILIASSSRNL